MVIKLRQRERQSTSERCSNQYLLKCLSHLNVCNFWCLNDISIQFSIQRPIPDVHGRSSAYQSQRLADISSVSHSYLSTVFTDVEMHMTCRQTSSIRQPEQNGQKHSHHILLNDTIHSGSDQTCKLVYSEYLLWESISMADEFIEGCMDQSTCLFEVWQHKTQDLFMKQTKQDSQRHLSAVFVWLTFTNSGFNIKLAFHWSTTCPETPEQYSFSILKSLANCWGTRNRKSTIQWTTLCIIQTMWPWLPGGKTGVVSHPN